MPTIAASTVRFAPLGPDLLQTLKRANPARAVDPTGIQPAVATEPAVCLGRQRNTFRETTTRTIMPR